MKHFEEIYELYELGWLHLLRLVQPDDALVEHDFSIFHAYRVLDKFISGRRNAEMLPGSVETARKLFEVVRKLHMASSDPQRRIEHFEASNLRQGLANFEVLLAHDLAKLPAYIVEKTGIYNVDDLINNADAHLFENTLKLVNQFVKEEMKRSGRSLAFDLFTSCGFHAVRAVEQVARDYLKQLTGKDAQASEMPLGGVLKGLRDYRDAQKMSDDSPLGLAISNLARLNNIYRKPLTHPEMVLETRDAARQVFDLAALLISQMAENTAVIS